MTDEQFKQFLEASFRSFLSAAKPGASLYVSLFFLAARVPEAAGFEVRCQIIWAIRTAPA